ncbi:MAG: HAD-IC family P-type ATPase, partial [Candidatus Cloacimonadaceae bacterium]|nr:HAD-IC family P-type ATPase [Candidatus Cloacimonadaceae bacterium]
LIHISQNGNYQGFITLMDDLKPGLAETVSQLRNLGVKHLSMLSGDREQKVLQVADMIGLDSCYSELLPEDKLNMVEKLQRDANGLLAYVGDGLNDAPVLTRADIGIAMGELGNQATIETADVVLLNDKPEQLVYAMRLSGWTYDKALQNIYLALSIKVLVMILGAFGLSSLWEAIIADVGVTLLAIANAMRLAKR